MSNLHNRLDAMLKCDAVKSILPPEADYADETLACRFTERHREDLKYVNTWGRWLVWDGMRWRIDVTLLVTDYVRTQVHEESEEIFNGGGKRSLATRVASAKTISAIERLARAGRQHASQTSDWDADPWLLNTPTGTIDLRTGNVRPHEHRDLITKITSVGPGGDCPKWLEFLNRIFHGDQKLIAYIKRTLGYSLTGSIQEHALFFCYGTGGNGKGVLLGTWHNILGEYSVIAPIATFTASQNERHPTELAMLQGARLVVAQETEDGQRWAESKIKALTGGDPVSARFMRQDFFTFHPTFKLLIAGNHKPSLRNVDEAIRRRLNLVPFTVTIPGTERDPALAEKLRDEWGGILSWAIDGCLEWQRIGLAPPSAVVEATESYLTDEDAVGRFIAEKCERDPLAHEELKDLYAEWKRFSEASGEPALSEKSFSQKLTGRNLVKTQHPRTRRVCFRGIRLRPEADEPEAWGEAAYSTFNARAEEFTSKPAFRDAWKNGQRCLVVTDGFYEWKKLDETGKDKQPYAVAMADDGQMVMAGLWAKWKDPKSGGEVQSCTILTCGPNNVMAELHNRMPVILGDADWPTWLGEEPAAEEQLLALLKPCPDDWLKFWPVDKKVGNVRNQGAELAAPIYLASTSAEWANECPAVSAEGQISMPYWASKAALRPRVD